MIFNSAVEMFWISREFPMKSSQRYSRIGRREWWRHHSGRRSNYVKMFLNLKFPIPSGFCIASFLLELELETIVSFCSDRKILSDVFRWCEAVPVFEGYAIPHAIFKMKAGYTDIQAPKSHSYDGKEPAEFGVPLKWKFSAFSGGWTRHHWKTEDSNGHVLRLRWADGNLWRLDMESLKTRSWVILSYQVDIWYWILPMLESHTLYPLLFSFYYFIPAYDYDDIAFIT